MRFSKLISVFRSDNKSVTVLMQSRSNLMAYVLSSNYTELRYVILTLFSELEYFFECDWSIRLK